MQVSVQVRGVSLAVAFVCAMSFVGSNLKTIQAGTISVNFIGGSAGSNVGNLSAGVVPTVGWMDVTGGTQSNLALLDNLGNNSGATLSFSGASSGAGNTTLFPNTGGDFQMMKGNIFRSNADLDLVIGGMIPYGQFDLYVYFNGAVGSTDSQNFTILQAALTKLAVDGALINETGFVESDGVVKGNYIRFVGLSNSTLPNFTLRASRVVGQYAYLNGFEIVDTTPVPAPEPTSLLLLGAGGALVVRRVRKHRVA